MVKQPVGQFAGQAVEVDGEALGVRHHLRGADQRAGQRVGVNDVLFGVFFPVVHLGQRSLQVVDRKQQRVEVPFDQAARESLFFDKAAVVGFDGVAQVIDVLARVGAHVQRPELREVRRVDLFGNLLEVVAAQVEVFEILERREVLVQRYQTVGRDGEPAQLRELGDVLAGGEVLEEGVDVAVEAQLVGGRQVLHLERQLLFGVEHEEPGVFHAALLFGRVPLHALFPEDHVVPVVHAFAVFPACDGFERTGDGQQGDRVAAAGVLLDGFGGALRDEQVVLAGEFHLALWLEHHVGDTLVGLGVDAPVEAYGHLARADAAVEFDLIAVEFEPAFGRGGDFDGEVDVGLDLHVEITGAEGREVGHGNLFLPERDGVVETLLVDGDLLLVPGVLLLDAYHAAAGRVGQRRVDEDPALGGAAAVGRRNGNPRLVGGGDPVPRCRYFDLVASPCGFGFDGVAVEPERDVLVGVGATA